MSYSDWAALVVLIPKVDGSIQLCGDYKVTVIPVMKVHQFSVPTPEDLFATLAGRTAYTKLDLSKAHQQVVNPLITLGIILINRACMLWQRKLLHSWKPLPLKWCLSYGHFWAW